MPNRFEEWRLDIDGSRIKVVRTVSIEPREAEMLNGDKHITKLEYVPVVSEPSGEKATREELFAILESRGVKAAKNYSTEKLLEKVAETEPNENQL